MELEKSFRRADEKTGGEALRLVLAVMVLGVCATVIYMAGLRLFEAFDILPDGARPVIVLAMAVLGFAGMLGAGVLWRRGFEGLRRAQFEDATVTIAGMPRPGQSFEVHYTQPIKRAVLGMTVKLLMREWVQATSGSTTVTKTHDVIIDERALPATSSASLSQTVHFTLPADAMHTWATRRWLAEQLYTPEEMDAERRRWEERAEGQPEFLKNMLDIEQQALKIIGTNDNSITWHVLFEVGLANGPDYVQAWELPVEGATDVYQQSKK